MPVALVPFVQQAPAPPRVVPNDNRVAAGTTRGDTLRLRLVARAGDWHPDADDGPGVVVPAFAVEGGAPRIPGPLVRVRAGTWVDATVRNALPDTLRLTGLHARPVAGDAATLVLAPGASRVVRFRLDAPGTYHYWGTTTGRALAFRTGLDAQLTGAIVVDPARGAAPRDRILVLGMWTDTVARSMLPRHRVLGVVNGRSFPHGETLRYATGDSVRLRVINASGDGHPMHLHGFHFRMEARGDGVTDTLWTAGTGPLEVTELVGAGATAALTWVPTRAGNWLFHCHIPEHFSPRGALGMPPDTSGGHAAMHGMNGLVLGIVVRDAPGRAPATAVAEAPRRLRLLVRPNVGSTPAAPRYGYAWHAEGTGEPPPDSGLRAAPTLVLARGAPVAITIVNRLPEPTAVHWHGIELDPYYDGVPGFSGVGRRTTPLLAPGDSFTVRFAPPRAGTYLYHTHHDEERQQGAGLVGPIVVLEGGTARDTTYDRTLLVTSPASFDSANRLVLVNARATPDTVPLVVGRPTRLRLANMTLRRAGLSLWLLRGEAAVPWRIVGKDGAAVADGAPRAARPGIGIGETLDLEITPDAAGPLELRLVQGAVANGRVFARVPLLARAP